MNKYDKPFEMDTLKQEKLKLTELRRAIEEIVHRYEDEAENNEELNYCLQDIRRASDLSFNIPGD